MPELILDTSTPCTVLLEHILETSQVAKDGDLINEKAAIKLVCSCFKFDDGSPFTENDLKALGRDYGIFLNALFREALNPVDNLEINDIDLDSENIDANETLMYTRDYTVDGQHVEISPITTMHLTQVSAGLAQNNFKRPFFEYLKRYYKIDGKPFGNYKEIKYSTMCIIWAQVNQLIKQSPKFKKSYGLKESSTTISEPLTPIPQVTT